jgi:hypothetical protein
MTTMSPIMADIARNLAEVIDDLYRQHAPPRDHERMIALVQKQIERAMWLARKGVQQEPAA